MDFIEELARFPEEPNDRGDALSQLIVKLNSIVLMAEDHDDDGGSIMMNGDSGDADLGQIDLGGVDMGFTGGFVGGDDGTL